MNYRRSFRIHRDGATLLGAAQIESSYGSGAESYRVTPIRPYDMEIQFQAGNMLVIIDNVMVLNHPDRRSLDTYSRVEFLYNESRWIIEHRCIW